LVVIKKRQTAESVFSRRELFFLLLVGLAVSFVDFAMLIDELYRRAMFNESGQ
jgi:hypothetical protein